MGRWPTLRPSHPIVITNVRSSQSGWNSFQQLCLTITSEVLGQAVESFLDSRDGGRDGAFTGKWNAPWAGSVDGSFVVQCKFTSRSNHVLRTSDLADEVEKAKRLVAKGLCDSYLLMTNAGLSGTRGETMKGLFKAAGVKHVGTFGSTWISQQIRETSASACSCLACTDWAISARFSTTAPTRRPALSSNRYATILLRSLLQTHTGKRRHALDKHGFVLLVGEPAAGKTTIASMLAMAAVDKWHALMLKLDDPGKVADRWTRTSRRSFSG